MRRQHHLCDIETQRTDSFQRVAPEATRLGKDHTTGKHRRHLKSSSGFEPNLTQSNEMGVLPILTARGETGTNLSFSLIHLRVQCPTSNQVLFEFFLDQ